MKQEIKDKARVAQLFERTALDAKIDQTLNEIQQMFVIDIK